MKRIISIFLIVLMLLPNVVYASDDRIYVERDTKELVQKLNILGVFDKFDDEVFFGDNSPIKRSEAAVALSSMLGMNNYGDTSSAEVKFFDVPQYCEYIYAVNYITSLGIMSANEDGLFRPDENMRIGHVLKCMVVALGYGWKAESYGGYPHGYLRVASELEFSISGNIEDIATRIDFLRFIDEALEKPICQTIGFSGDNVNIEIDEDVNILSEYHNIFIDEGIVKNNKIMTISEATEGYDGVVFIGNRRLVVNDDTDISSLVGYNVEYYYRYDKDIDESELLIAVPTEDNEVTCILKEDFGEYRNNEITYWNEKGKSKSLTLSSSVAVLNNSDLTTDVSNAINNYEGTLTAIDNNHDDRIDVVIVKNYTYDKVKNVNIDEGKLYTERKIFNINTYDCISITDTLTGNQISLADITVGEIVGFAENMEKEKLILERIGSGSAIKIESITESSFYTDSGNEYSASLLNDEQKALIKPSKTVSIVLIDKYYAVWADVPSEAVNTGYLMKIGNDTKWGENVLEGVMILDVDGRVNIYEPENGEKITFNGKKIKTSLLEGMLSEVKATNGLGGDGVVSQVISYKLNDEGQITHIYTIDENYDSKLYLKYSTENRGKVQIYDQDKEGAKFGPVGSKNYSLNYRISMTNPIFRVPYEGQDSASEDNFNCTTYTEEDFAGTGEDGNGWRLDSYVKEERAINPHAVVIFMDNAEIDITDEDMTGKKGKLILVEDTYWALDDDGDARFVLEGLYNNSTKKYYFDDVAGNAAKTIKANSYNAEEEVGFTTGDVACIACDNFGDVIKVHKVFDRETMTLNDIYKLYNGKSEEDTAAYTVNGTRTDTWVIELWSVYNKSEDGTVLEAFEGDLLQGLPGDEKMRLYNVSSELREQKKFAFYDDYTEKVHFGDAQNIVDYYQDPTKYTVFLVRHNGGWLWDNQIFYNFNN